MRQNKTKTLGEILQLYVKAFRMEDKITEAQIIKLWNESISQNIKMYITEVKIFNKVLFVYTNSSVMRNELHLRKTAYLQMLTEKVGKENLTDIVFR